MLRTIAVLLAVGVLAAAFPAVAHAGLAPGSHGKAVLALQKKLIRLKYLAHAGRTGIYGPRTSQAVMAFQGWRGLTRDGVAGPSTFKALAKASIPRPWSRTVRHMEVHKAKQVLLLIAKGKVVRAIHVSTASPGHVTPSGHFTIYRKEAMSWSSAVPCVAAAGLVLHGRIRVPPVSRRTRLPGITRLRADRPGRRQHRVEVGDARYSRSRRLTLAR